MAFRVTSDLKQIPVLSGVQCDIWSVWAVSAATLLMVSLWCTASHHPPLSFQFDTHFTFQRYPRSIPMFCSQKCKDRRQFYSIHLTSLCTLAGKHMLRVVMVADAWSSTDCVLALELSCDFFILCLTSMPLRLLFAHLVLHKLQSWCTFELHILCILQPLKL